MAYFDVSANAHNIIPLSPEAFAGFYISAAVILLF